VIKGIGSVLPAPVAATPVRSAFSEMIAEQDWRGFRTGRAALAALLRHRGIKRVWLPAYVCTNLADGSGDCEIIWYATGDRLNVVPEALDGVRPGDAVVVIDYFGRSPSPDVRGFTQNRDILWIEDRAQAVAPDADAFGQIVLYSPRKLFGVGDGGILVGDNLPDPVGPEGDDVFTPNDLRAADPDGLDPAPWFHAFRSREAAFDATPAAISPRTLAALKSIDPARETAARKANWAVLAAALPDLALWRIKTPDFAPLAFPVVVNDAATLSAHMAANRIWCARHWAELPSPQAFAVEHALSRQCLSLPLDGRYDSRDMERIVATIRELYPR
jgi:dTDP-4-amino-4,6-dideoxygalactose transaminase